MGSKSKVVVDYGCVRGDVIHAMNANTTNTVYGANSAITLASSMNDFSVALAVINQRNLILEIKLM